MYLASAVLGAAVALAAGQTTTSCSWSSAGSSFDLSPLRLSSPARYNVSDFRKIDTLYYFNVCGEVATPPTDPADRCISSNRDRNEQPATAWQVENDGANADPDNCYRLGDYAFAGWTFSTFDPEYPARGLVLTYGGGDDIWCADANGKRNRTMSLALVCSANNNMREFTEGGSGVSVVETSACSYSVQLPSLAACPQQCLTGSSICNGNGVCGYNRDALASQCYCYSGFEGSKCGDVTPTGMSVEGVMLIIVCIALAGVLAFLGFILVRLRRLSVNPQAYDNLQGRCKCNM